MQLIPNQAIEGDVPGWYSDDETKLYFFNQTTFENPDRRNNPPPETIPASIIGRAGKPNSITMPIAHCAFLGPGFLEKRVLRSAVASNGQGTATSSGSTFPVNSKVNLSSYCVKMEAG